MLRYVYAVEEGVANFESTQFFKIIFYRTKLPY